MGKSYEEVLDEMTVKQFKAFQMKVWATLGGRETGEVGMKRLMSGQARLMLEDIVQKTAEAVKSEWQTLLKACRQDCGEPHFTKSRWPLGPVAADEAGWEVTEYRNDHSVTGFKALQHLEDMVAKSNGQFRLMAGSRLAMEYIAKHPDAQLDHMVILPISALDPSDCWCLPVFGNWLDIRKRSFGLFNTAGMFRPHCGWLVLKRKQK
ncbi:MAG: hypothetical protein AAB568_01795 [Patescibacteria group bacterium]